MQVEHDVVAERQLHQPRLQSLVGGAKRGVGQQLGVGRGEQRKAAVEIVAGAEMEAALMFAEMILRAADRVGPGHDGDVALDAAFGFGLVQRRHQRVDGDDARQFAGMEGRLQIGRGRGLVGAGEAEHREFVGNAFGIAGDAFDRFLHGLPPGEARTHAPLPKGCRLVQPAALWAQCGSFRGGRSGRYRRRPFERLRDNGDGDRQQGEHRADQRQMGIGNAGGQAPRRRSRRRWHCRH